MLEPKLKRPNPNEFISLPIVLLSGDDTMAMLLFEFDELVKPNFPLAIISISTFGSGRTSMIIVFDRTLAHTSPNSSWL
jgi:hypothetical protein